MIRLALACCSTLGIALGQCAPTWLPALSPSPHVVSFAVMPTGDLVAGGLFASVGGVPAQNIARWDGSVWSPLGAGVNGTVAQMAVAPNGDLIVGGTFSMAGGAPAQNIARWDGISWSPLGSGTASVRGIAVRSTGEVIAAVGGVVASYNGTTWTELPDLSAPHFRSAVTLPDDDVLVLGDGWMLPWGGTAIARWNGTAFSAMGGANWGQAMHALVRRNGELLVAGNNLDVQPAGYSSIVRWTGSSFVALDPALTGTVYSLAELPNGDVIAAGALLRNGLPIGNLMRWNGASWSPIAGDVGGHANDVAVDGQGRIFVAGSFATAGGITAPGFARTDLPCPAAVAAFGSGCVSAAGPVALAAENLPWAGATHRSLATGMASPSLAVHIVGLSALTQPLPFGAPGCLSFVDPLHTQFLVPNGGQCVIATVLPNTPVFAGIQLLTQVVQLELDAAGQNLVRTSASNGLALTIGAM